MIDTAKLIERLDDASGAMCSFPDHRDINLHGLTERAGTFLDGVHDLLIESRHALTAAESTVASLRAEVERLTKALEPFATAHRVVHAAVRSTGKVLDDEDAMQSGFAWRDKDGNRKTVTWGDLRSAARALDRSPSVESGNG